MLQQVTALQLSTFVGLQKEVQQQELLMPLIEKSTLLIPFCIHNPPSVEIDYQNIDFAVQVT